MVKGKIMKQIIVVLMLIIAGSGYSAGCPEFTLDLEFEDSKAKSLETIAMGMDDDASLDFDSDIDIPLPPPTGTGYYFVGTGAPPTDKLATDIRNTGDIGTIWEVNKTNFSLGVVVSWDEGTSIFDDDTFKIYHKIQGIFDPAPARPRNDSTWILLDSVENISYNPTLEKLYLSLDSLYIYGMNIGEHRGIDLPKMVELHPNRPNPFNATTVISFSVPVSEKVRVVIDDILGRNVCTIFDGIVNCGEHEFVWDGRDETGQEMPTGTYNCKLITEQGCISRRMVLLR